MAAFMYSSKFIGQKNMLAAQVHDSNNNEIDSTLNCEGACSFRSEGLHKTCFALPDSVKFPTTRAHHVALRFMAVCKTK